MARILCALIKTGCASTGGLIACSLALVLTARAADTITLENGLTLEGVLGKISSVGADPLSPTGAGEVKLKRIIIVDDQLRRTFVGTNQVATAPAPAPAIGSEKFVIPQRVSVAGRAIGGVGPIVRVTPFDEWGRRIFTMNTQEGNVDIVQGITEITPKWTRVQAVQGGRSFIWTMYLATSSIPRETLSKILYHHIDPANSDHRLRIVRLYTQSERIQDARAELEQFIKDFPKLDALKAQVKTLNQMAATRLIKEIELRRDVGQPLLAIAMLEKFPEDGVAGETLLKVREILEQFKEQEGQGQQVVKWLDEHLAALKDEKLQKEFGPVVAEIKSDLNIHNFDRMADYLRLASDETLSAEQKLSLAVSGWLLGSGSGVDNLGASMSLVQVRELVRQYLTSKRKPERDAILAELKSLEAATPDYLAKIIAHMTPPLAPAIAAAEGADVGNVKDVLGPAPAEKPAQPKAVPPPVEKAAPPPGPPAKAAPGPVPTLSVCGDEPKKEGLLDADLTLPKLPGVKSRKPLAVVPPAAAPVAGEKPAADPEPQPVVGATGIPGLFELTVPGLPEEPEIKYWVQLPPEYSPYRRYPCVVTLNGAGTTPQQQIDWWAGAYNSDAQTRYGQAARHGYIVIAPRWTKEHQRKYEFTSREHAAVLVPLRDAGKRFAIDTDRVFLSGHSMGGDAAWDIGLAHPDLWAGVLPIVATGEKYVTRYWENARYVSFYFVSGEKDGNKLGLNATDWDRYLTHSGYDTVIVQYQGRGHEHFHDEIQEIFKWMNLHKRDFFPREIETFTMRPWDKFFWWVEADKFPMANMVLPAEFPKPGSSPGKIDAKILETNAIRVTTGADRVTVWVAPEMVNFGEKVTVTINNKRQLNIVPSASVLLEDVRSRGDRLHPFWARVDHGQ